MAKVTRVLVYEMAPADMEKQLAGSLPDGCKEFVGKTITVYTLPSSWRLLRLLKLWLGV